LEKWATILKSSLPDFRGIVQIEQLKVIFDSFREGLHKSAFWIAQALNADEIKKLCRHRYRIDRQENTQA